MNVLASPQSTGDGSPYITPTDGVMTHEGTGSEPRNLSEVGTKVGDGNTALINGAAHSLQTMLADLLGVLRKQVDASIQLTGDLSLRIAGSQSYVIKLSVDEGSADSPVRVRASQSRSPRNRKRAIAEFGEGFSKRARFDVPDTRTKEDADPGELEGEAEAISADDTAKTLPKDQSTSTEPSLALVLKKLDHISEQVKWVEDCRRVAEIHHATREENWRSSSAIFHDESRIAREKHEIWLAREMGWQRDMLNNVRNGVRSANVISQSLKWEVPENTEPIQTSARSIFATTYGNTEKRDSMQHRGSKSIPTQKQMSTTFTPPPTTLSSINPPGIGSHHTSTQHNPTQTSVRYEVPARASLPASNNQRVTEQAFSMIHVGVKPRDGNVDPTGPRRKLEMYAKAYDTTSTPQSSISGPAPASASQFIHYGSTLSSELSKSASRKRAPLK